jgi:hypothetical protein
VPLVGAFPVFETLSVYVPVPPTTKLPLCDLFAWSTGAPFTVVGSLAVGEFDAPPPVALTLFVTLGTAVVSTLTFSVMGFAFAPAAIADDDVHVTVCPDALHDQPVPEAEA